MRVQFSFDLSSDELSSREELEMHINEWWHAFVATAQEISALFKRQSTLDLPDWMASHLSPISPDLCWEFGPGILKKHRLVITPESACHLRPVVTQMLALAPHLEDWEFYGYRLPESAEDAARTVNARNGAELGQMRFVLSHGDFNRIDVRCIVGCDYPEDKMRATGFVGLESLLGEEMLDRWIGYIDYEIADSFPEKCVPAEKVLTAARQLLDEIAASLNPTPIFVEGTEEKEWSLFKLEPSSDCEDYPDRTDLLTQLSIIPSLHSCCFSGSPFDSIRFSRNGETFAYVKIDGSSGLPDWGFQDRDEIENALISALEPANLGSLVGTGNGLRYSYVDLALTDVEQAVPIIRETLIRGGVPVRSWLLFFDSIYKDEWIGIHHDSPPPPR